MKCFLNRPLFLAVVICCLSVFNVFGQKSPEEVWGKAIAQFQQTDSVSALQPDQILMLGSSSFTIWQDVEDYFPGKKFINRGFGGSKMSDVLYFKEKLVLPYHPKQIIIYEGENDVASGEKPDVVLAEFNQLINWVRTKCPGVKFTVISLKPSPRRWAIREEMIAFNQKLKKFAGENDDIDFVDIWNPLLEGKQKPTDINYRPDSLHLSPNGYKIWQRAMAPYLF
jgi:lysophospholipase L1-like esterase